MTTDSTLQAAYDRAVSVMSSPCRFVEWKTYGGGLAPDGWYPIGLEGDPAGYVKEIDTERWIYVFRRHAQVRDSATWVDEIHLPKKGGKDRVMEAVNPSPALDGKEELPAPRTLGKTVSFARRINGVAMEYYFLSTRIRLPPKLVLEFMGEITSYVHPVSFEPNDTNIVGREGDVLLVPVLDPLTVAEHLHLFFDLATQDYFRYQFAGDGMTAKEKEAVIRRQKKVILGELLDSLQKNDTSNTLMNWLAGQGTELETFLQDHRNELAFRLEWRSTWCKLLTAWLQSPTMRILAKAHSLEPEKHFAQYLVIYCMCLGGLGSCEIGRGHLEAIAADRTHFINDFVLPDSEPSEPFYQVIRKATSAILEALKEYAPASMRGNPVVPWFRTVKAMAIVTEAKSIVIDGQAINWRKQKVTVTKASHVALDPEPPSLKPSWQGALTGASLVLEIINFSFAIRANDAAAGKSLEDRALAMVNLIGSGMDLTTAYLSLFRLQGKTIPTIGLVSAMIDVFLAYGDEAKAIQKGDGGVAFGAAIVATGSLEGVLASLMALAGVPGAGVAAIAGLAIVALGRAIMLFAGWGDKVDDSQYSQLLNYCEWGRRETGDEDRADFSPVPFEYWDENVDAQLAAAVNVLAAFTLEKNTPWKGGEQFIEDLREARLKTSWFPPGSVLKVVYEERWAYAGNNRDWKADIHVTESGLSIAKDADLVMRSAGDNTYVLRPRPTALEIPTKDEHQIGGVTVAKTRAAGLTSITIRARLHILYAGIDYSVPHHKDVSEPLA